MIGILHTGSHGLEIDLIDSKGEKKTGSCTPSVAGRTIAIGTGLWATAGDVRNLV